MWKLPELKYSGLHPWQQIYLVGVSDVEHMQGPSVGHVPIFAQGTCPLSLLCPAADTRNLLHSCFLQLVLPLIKEYTMLTNNSQLFLKDTFAVAERKHTK